MAATDDEEEEDEEEECVVDDAVMQSLREVIVWPQRYGCVARALTRGEGEASFQRWRWPHGALLHGPAGVGKTYAVRKAAREVVVPSGSEEQMRSKNQGAEIFVVTPEMISGEYVGDSEQKMREIFEGATDAARRASSAWASTSDSRSQSMGPPPVILLLENIDVICPPRSATMQNESRVVAQLLLLMDGLAAGDDHRDDDTEEGVVTGDERASPASAGRVVVIATTEKPNAIDEALRRPGRLEREVRDPLTSDAAPINVALAEAGASPRHPHHARESLSSMESPPTQPPPLTYAAS